MRNNVLNYGSTTQGVIDSASNNFGTAKINPVSRCCTPIEILSLDGDNVRLNFATGFYWTDGSDVYLVTNWHVFSGKNFFTGEVLDRNALIPRKMRIQGNGQIIGENGPSLFRIPMIVELDDYSLEYLSNLENMKNNKSDIIAIKVPQSIAPTNQVVDRSENGLGETNLSCAINEFVYQRVSVQSGDELFIPGYPIGNFEGLFLPVWRRGSLATESLLGMGRHKAFLVDATVRSGMSGSPVLRSVSIPSREKSTSDLIVVETHFDFIGVYAGRLSSTELLETNLGYAWFASEIDEIARALSPVLEGHIEVRPEVP